MQEKQFLTVTELNLRIQKSIKNDFDNNILVVKGEISNLKCSGKHTYLTLKDSNSSINVVFFGQSLDNSNGENVEIIGYIDFYCKTGQANLRGMSIKMEGVGNLHIEYENIKKKYQDMGYFNNKKPLPKLVKNIGIITSYNGAALQDFLYVLEKNKFSGNVYIYDCIVQGAKCSMSITSGIKFFNNSFIPNNDDNDSIDSCDYIDVDMIVITRGGGSFEDLIGFSHPKVLDAIYKSSKYTISAVGHEIDNMLSDYVANYRAPTPSVAGEVICSIANHTDMLFLIENNIKKIRSDMINQLYKYKNTLHELNNKIVNPYKQVNDRINNILIDSVKYVKKYLLSYKQKIDNFNNILQKHNYQEMMNEGMFLIVNNNGEIVKNIKNIFNKQVTLIHQSGYYEVTIKKSEKIFEKKLKKYEKISNKL